MRFSFRRARNIRPWPVLSLLACLLLLLLGLFLPPSTSADPPSPVGISSVAEGAADDLLGQLVNLDFSQPDFTHGTANDSISAEDLEAPSFVALDTANHRLFVADTNNHRVLVFDLTAANALADHRADRVLGQADFKAKDANRGGSAAANTLASPQGLAYDSAGSRLFVADSSNHRVLAYDTASITNGQNAVAVLGQANFTSTASATTRASLNGPTGIAYGSPGGRLFVADQSDHRVLVYDAAIIVNGENAAAVLGQADFTSNLGNRGGAAAANTLIQPLDVAYDSAGSRLFVAENGGNNRLLVYDVTTIVDGENAVNVLGQANFTSTGFATTQSSLSPSGVAYDATGSRLFVADGNNRVTVFNVATILDGENAEAVLGQANFTSSTAATSQSGFRDGPFGLAYASTGSLLFVADNGNHRVLAFDVAAIGNGEAAVDLLGQIDPSGVPVYTTRLTGSARASNRGLSSPGAAALDAVNHRLFVADYANNRVLVYDLDASNRPLDRQPDAVLGQADFTSGSANRGGSAAANTLWAPWGLAYDPSGSRLFVVDSGNARVLVYAATTISNGQNAAAVLGQANFTSGSNNRGGSATANTLASPIGLTYDASGGRLLVADGSNNRVLVYSTATISNGQDAVAVLGQATFTSTASASSPSGLNLPAALAYASTGSRLFVADRDNHRVLAYDLAAITNGENAVAVLGQNNFISNTFATTQAGLNSPVGLAYDPNGGRLFVAERDNNRLAAYDVASVSDGENAVAVLGQTSFLSNTAATTQSGLSGPTGVAYEGSTNLLYVVDGNNNRVLLFNAAPLSTSLSINGGAVYATALTATLALTATGASQMQVSESASFTGASYQAYATTLPFTLSAGDGTRAIYARFQDSALGVSTAVSDTIIVDTTPPLTFTLSSPATGTFTNTASPTFAWEGSSDATSGLAKYQLYVDGSLNRDGIITTTTSITPTSALTDGLHTWKVAAVDSLGNSGDSSSTNSLTVDTTPPAAFVLASPATGAITNTAAPSFSWESSSDATSGLARYQLYLDGTLNRDNILTSANSITATGALTDGVHTWRVVAVDNAGNSRESGSSNSVTVDTVAPSPSQVSATGVTTGTATISWSSSEASSALVEYGATDAYGAATAEADTSPRATSHSVALAGLTPGTTYHYRVKGQDQAGNLGVSGDNTFSTLSPVSPLSNTYIPLLTRSFAGAW